MLINIITHASKIFKALDIVLRNTLVAEILGFKLVPLVEPIDTRNEQLVNDLNEIWFSRGDNVNPLF
jgi:hypothetical protein